MTKTCHGNAEVILPRELFEAVQGYCFGLHLWIPKPKRIERQRRKLVLELHAKRVPINEIAQRAGVTPRRVKQMLGADQNVKMNRVFKLAARGVNGLSVKQPRMMQNAPPPPKGGPETQFGASDR